MIDFAGIQVGMTPLGLLGLVAGAIVLGLIGQVIGDTETPFEWIPDAVAAFIGGYIASEMLGGLSTTGPEVEGVFVVPAVIGAVVFAVVVDLLVRMTTGGSLTHRGHPA
jgi:uncharacterized membrane protein YeaQ/YmgE (transglycosylase-associated protein family)